MKGESSSTLKTRRRSPSSVSKRSAGSLRPVQDHPPRTDLYDREPIFSTLEVTAQVEHNDSIVAAGVKPLSARPPQRSKRPPRSSGSSRQWRGVGLESATMIGVNLLLITSAVGGLCKLLPMQMVQYSRLQELDAKVKSLGQQVNEMQAGLDRAMDPLQEEALLKERTGMVHPNEAQVRFIAPTTPPGAQVASQSEPSPQR